MTYPPDPYAPPQAAPSPSSPDKTGLPELDALLDFMDRVDSALDRQRPIDLSPLPKLIQAVCQSIENWPVEQKEDAIKLIANIDGWLDETRNLITPPENQTNEDQTKTSKQEHDEESPNGSD